MTSDKPLTLGEMADFFLSVWPLVDVLEMDFERDVNRRLASSPPNQSSILILIGSVGIESLKPSLSQREKKSAIVISDDSQSCTYRALIKKAEAVLPKGAHGSDSAHDISETSQGKRKPGRAVLVIVTEWPSGTMAMKFGSAMKRALRLTQDEMRVVRDESRANF